MHFDCIGCRAREDASPCDGGIVLLAMLRGGASVDGVYRDLCFAHRRTVDNAAKAVREQAG